MKYCGVHNISEVWVGDGLNPCFINTITSGVLFLYMFIGGCIQCSLYRKHGATVGSQHLPGSVGFGVQIFLTFILAVEAVTNTILYDTSINEQVVYGYQVFTSLCLLYAWSASMRLLFYERGQALPSIPKRRHGYFLLVYWILAFVKENLPFISWWSPDYWWNLENISDKMEFGLWLTRYSCTTILLTFGIIAASMNRNYHLQPQDPENLELDPSINGRGSNLLDKSKDSSWTNVISNIKVMIPYVWPKGSWWRQCLVVLCLVILGAGRGVNVLVPIYSRDIVNSLTEPFIIQAVQQSSIVQSGQQSGQQSSNVQTPLQSSSNNTGQQSYNVLVTQHPPSLQAAVLEFRWDLILMYGFLLFLRGGGAATNGFLRNARSFLWIPVQQYTTRRIQVKLFSHLHSLSLRWHLQRKTGEVLRIVDRGTNSINSLLSYLIFQILPTTVDIVIAIIYFITAFNYIFGLVVFLSMVMYLGVTIWLTEWRTRYMRDMNKYDNQRNAKSVDSLLNFETVKYYGASEFETNRYDEAIKIYQKAEWKSTALLNLLNTMQNAVISFGMLVGSLLCAFAVVHSISDLKLTVGDYVLFGTYLTQLYGPLNWLGTFYRVVQQSFIDMENMFELLDENQEVKDTPDANEIVVTKGEIEFRDVHFYYEPSKPVLSDISFTVPAGQTYALVGHSGSGKSTLIRLLFRFYDVTHGKIIIDGQDIALVKQESLRQKIGVVPQDTVLFNDDIRYNIRYGNVKAKDDEVERAADAADIHERILGFPKKYETVVGERGLKLSGGEKQRVAIARTILKNPAIVLLDEATSALDTKTERNIQTSLEEVCENRTTVIVAHRLSTIIHAHQILVMNEGQIMERGTHEELLRLDGLYAEMWNEQLTKREEALNGDINGDVKLNLDTCMKGDLAKDCIC